MDDSTSALTVAGAFTSLREPVRRYLRTLGIVSGEEEELVQETFLRLCNRTPRAGVAENLRAWVFRVAQNLARDHHRRKVRSRVEPLEARSAFVDPRRTPEQEVLEQERVSGLQDALARLPEQQRHCLRLRAQGLRYREISAAVGAPVSTVAEWVQQGLTSLLEELNGHGR